MTDSDESKYYEGMEFQELLHVFIGKAAGLMNPNNSHATESGDYYLMPSGLVVEFGVALNAIIAQVFEDAERSRKEKIELAKELTGVDIEVEVDVEVPDPPTDYPIPENVIRTLGQLKGWKVDLNNFEDVSKELRDLGDIDVLDWVYRNPNAYSWFIKKKAW